MHLLIVFMSCIKRHCPQAGLILLLASLSACANKSPDKYKDMTAEQIYAQGQQNLKKGRYFSAVEDFEGLESHHPYGEYADKGLLDLTYAYNKQGEPEAALAANERFIQLYPTHPDIDYAYYLRGMIYYDQNMSMLYRYIPIDRSYRDNFQAEKAFENFAFLVKHFPKSRFVPDARQRLIFLRDQLAQHQLHIAEYYLKRKAFVAVAERANYILTHFDGTSAIPPALEILKTAYLGMDMPTLAEDVQKIIDKNTAQQEIS
jgi:outer membrane protein assembly factor BamD